VTYEESAAWDAEVWVQRVEAMAAGERSVMFVADDGGRLVGIAGGYVDPEEPDVPHLISMWVAPDARRRGVGRELVEAVADWARERGFGAIRLFITTGNETAAALYTRCGFKLTGRTIPLPRDPSVLEIEMRRDLAWQS
jgi:GNAT superfamily N-acetyltransferase